MRPARSVLVILLVGLSQLIFTADLSFVSVAIPSIAREFSVAGGTLSWVVTAATLVMAGGIVLGGRACDRIGPRLCSMAGIGLFVAAATVLVLSRRIWIVFLGRALIGLASAFFSPANYSLVFTAIAPGRERRQALGLIGAAQGASLVIGLVIGGAVTTAFGWRAVFGLDIIMGLVALTLAAVAIPRVLASPGGVRAKAPPDVAGSLVLVVAPSLLIAAVTLLSSRAWDSVPGAVLLGLAVLLLCAFPLIERGAADPVVPMGLFRIPNVLGANLSHLLLGASVVGAYVLLNLHLQRPLGLSAMTAGLAMLPYAAALTLTGRLLTVSLRRWSTKRNIYAGVGCQVAGMALLSFSAHQTGYSATLVGGLILMAGGSLMALLAIYAQANGSVPGDRQGTATGVFSMAYQLGISLGAPLVLAVAAALGDGTAFLLCAAISLLVIPATAVLTCEDTVAS